MFVRNNSTKANAEVGGFSDSIRAKSNIKKIGSYNCSSNAFSLSCARSDRRRQLGKDKHVRSTFAESRLCIASSAFEDGIWREDDHREIMEATETFRCCSNNWNIDNNFRSDIEQVPP